MFSTTMGCPRRKSENSVGENPDPITLRKLQIVMGQSPMELTLDRAVSLGWHSTKLTLPVVVIHAVAIWPVDSTDSDIWAPEHRPR